MDYFKIELNKQCDVGGLKCDCCNPSWAKSRNKRRLQKIRMKKRARTRLKAQMKKEINMPV